MKSAGAESHAVTVTAVHARCPACSVELPALLMAPGLAGVARNEVRCWKCRRWCVVSLFEGGHVETQGRLFRG